MNWQEQTVSMLEGVRSCNPRTITLGAWVKATKTSNITTPKRDRPALMPHGMFVGGRRAEHCTVESALVQFDIDQKHNPNLCVDLVKRLAAHCEDIVWCARSAGGGAYGFAVRRGDLDKQLSEIEKNLRVVLDRCNSRNVAALRFASYDPNPYEHI